eukprot:CAMPEP_0119301918 /NCGR_PEP_ID=MMETSP1333-20130426/3621_1 /TAXON_ID=418940 /ORGANISM="Scyphosphaera apsteinii, Strain RCC1455" /LENGTH=117 /DNA_ID=CAMNT_0007304129 /DNA_START=248 /DNA_END=601 /DNA_ORIENTATION=-
MAAASTAHTAIVTAHTRAKPRSWYTVAPICDPRDEPSASMAFHTAMMRVFAASSSGESPSCRSGRLGKMVRAKATPEVAVLATYQAYGVPGRSYFTRESSPKLPHMTRLPDIMSDLK